MQEKTLHQVPSINKLTEPVQNLAEFHSDKTNFDFDDLEATEQEFNSTGCFGLIFIVGIVGILTILSIVVYNHFA